MASFNDIINKFHTPETLASKEAAINSSWFPEYYSLVRAGDTTALSKFASEAPAKYGDWNPTAANIVSSQIANLQAQQDSDFNDTLGETGAALGTAGLIAGSLYGGYLGLEGLGAGGAGAAGAEAGAFAPMEAGVGTSVADLAGAGAAGAGGTAAAAMPAAIPETAAGLSEMGLTQTAPGVWAGQGATGLGTLGSLMPPAVPEVDPTFGGALSETAPGVYAAPEAAGYVGPSLGAGGALGASTLAATSGGGFAGGGGGSSGGGGSATGGGLMDDWLTEDWQRALLRGAPGLLGALGAASQAEDYEDLAHQYSQMGAPYRSRLESLYSNPEGFLNSPEVRLPIQQGTDMLARSLSVKGNPAGSGNALQELQNYTSNQLFSRLGQEKDRLGGFGGLTAYNQAAPQMASNVIGAQGNIYGSLGGAAADIFNPQRRYTLQDLLGY